MDLFSDTERKVTIRISELGSVEHAQRLIKEHKIDTELDFIAKFPFHYAALTPNSISLRRVFGGMLGAFIPRGEAKLKFNEDQLKSYCEHFKNRKEAAVFLEAATTFGFNNSKRREGLLEQINSYPFSFVLRDFESSNEDFIKRNDKSNNLTDLSFESFLGEVTPNTTLLEWMVSVSNNQDVFDIMFPHLAERYTHDMRWHILRPSFEKAKKERKKNNYLVEIATYLGVNSHQEGSYYFNGAQRLTIASWTKVINASILPKFDPISGLRKHGLELDVIYIRGLVEQQLTLL